VKEIKQKLTRYGAAVGVFNSNPTGAPIDGPLEVVFAGLMGALAGFFLGMLAGAITRMITMNGKNGSRGGTGWAAWGAMGGALAFAIMALLD
jgi:hypothetical protein